MADIFIQVLGCGDAFCSGSRHQTCFHVKTPNQSLLLDCGATSLLAMQRQKVDPSHIDCILLSHLHGDHFGGVPFLLMQAHFVAKRTKPLTVIGPEGTRQRIEAALGVFFPDIADVTWSFPFDVIELKADQPLMIDDVFILPFLVDHPSGAPSLAFRLKVGDRVLAFSGDTRWTDALIEIAEDADLLIAECHGYRPNGVPHLDWQTLNQHAADLRAHRILLTHLSANMLQKVASLDTSRFEIAEDGWTAAL